MSELTISQSNLPTSFEDVAAFAVIAQEKLKSVRAEISAIKRLGLAKEVLQQKMNEAQNLNDIKVHAEMKLGELTAAMEKSQGGRPMRNSSPTRTSFFDCEEVQGTEPVTKQNALEKAGIKKQAASEYERMAAHPEIVERVLANAREKNDIPSRASILNEIKKVERKQAIQDQVDEIERGNIEKPDGLFDVIAIDPPWNYGTQFDSNGRRVANPYPEMSKEELKALEIPAKENCVMFLWTTQRFIWDAKELLDAWGFTYRAMIVWDKEKIGMGDLIRMQCEFCLVGIKGKPVFRDAHDIRDIIREPRREHSRKPAAFYDMVDALCAGRKLDFFSREAREGWCCYGNDTEKF